MATDATPSPAGSLTPVVGATPAPAVPATEQVAWPGLLITAAAALATVAATVVSLRIAVQAKRQADRADERERRYALREQAESSAVFVRTEIVQLGTAELRSAQGYSITVNTDGPKVEVLRIVLLAPDGSHDFSLDAPAPWPFRSPDDLRYDFVVEYGDAPPPWRTISQPFFIVFRDMRGDEWRLDSPSRQLTLLNPRPILE